jgi:long-chain fatty acid transport protein
MKFSKLTIALLITGVSLPGLALATNGDNLIGLGAQSRAMGGTGTAAFYGSENALSNPALLAKMQGSEFAFGGTVFMPDVSASGNLGGGGSATSGSSSANTFVIPEVSLATRINNNWSFGLGMYGTSGMGVDYRDNLNLVRAYSNLQMMKFVPAFAYNSGSFGLGFAPVLQYGSLDINYDSTNFGGGNIGHGSKSDFGYGYNLGAYFDATKDLTFGLAYQSEIAMTYSGVITTAANGFGIGPTGSGAIANDKMNQPAELKAGVAYTMGPWMVTGDYKRVYWGQADGYKAFGWKDQDIFALGGKYSGNGWWIGAGYNHGKDPISTGTNTAINMFNNVFFPAITEDHYTLGGGLAIGKMASLDFAYVHAAKVSKTISTAALGGTTETTTHSQDGVTLSVRMNF